MDKRYQELAAHIGLGQSERIARLFAMLVDDTDADLMLAMPGQPAQLAEKLGLDPAEAEARIKTLFFKGVAFPIYKTDPPSWKMSRDLVQFHDATILWPDAPKEFLNAWRDYMEEEWPALAKVIAKMTPKPFTRVIPVGVTIKPKHQILDFDSVADMIRKSEKLAVTKCTCRLTMEKCDRPVEVCLQVNKGAEYNITRGTGREVSKDEAMRILKESEDAGLIHVTMNKSDINAFICNCCPCCCQTMPVLIQGGTHVVDPSRFAASISAGDCTACGVCEERCYFGAITAAEEDSPRVVDPDKCMGCGLCLVTCPTEAIELVETRPASFVPGAA